MFDTIYTLYFSRIGAFTNVTEIKLFTLNDRGC